MLLSKAVTNVLAGLVIFTLLGWVIALLVGLTDLVFPFLTFTQ